MLTKRQKVTERQILYDATFKRVLQYPKTIETKRTVVARGWGERKIGS